MALNSKPYPKNLTKVIVGYVSFLREIKFTETQNPAQTYLIRYQEI